MNRCNYNEMAQTPSL